MEQKKKGKYFDFFFSLFCVAALFSLNCWFLQGTAAVQRPALAVGVTTLRQNSKFAQLPSLVWFLMNQRSLPAAAGTASAGGRGSSTELGRRSGLCPRSLWPWCHRALEILRGWFFFA